MLTYKTHIDKTDMCSHIKYLHKHMEFVRCAHENADKSDPYEHTHVLVGLKRQADITKERYWDFADIHPNLKPINSKLHWERAKAYLGKEDLENKDLRPTNWIAQVETAECEEQAIQGKPNEYFARKDLYAKNHMRKFQSMIKIPELICEWQEDLKAEIVASKNYRKIIWVYDKMGNCGKTLFCKHMASTFREETLFLTNFGGQANTANVVLNFVKKGYTPKYILIDLPRTFEDKQIYEPLEVLKNGMLTNLKYEGESFMIDNPCVVVFANFFPHVIGESGGLSMSYDRWDVRQIKWKDENFTMFYESFEQLKKKCKKLYEDKKNLLNKNKD